MLFCAALVSMLSLTTPADVAISREALMQTLASLPEKRSPFGTPEHIEGLAQTEELILKRLRAAGYEPSTQEIRWALPKRNQADTPDQKPEGQERESQEPPRVWHNIVAEIKGASKPNEVLILGAHFDAVRQGPGADDNASGTAALLEIADALRASKPERTIRLIFFTLEEVGLIGSQNYVNRWRTAQAELPEDKRERIVGMVSMEMLGYYTDKPDSQQSPIKPIPGVFEPSTTGDFIAIVGLKTHQPFSRALAAAMQKADPSVKITLVDFLPLPIPDMARSDHAPFWLAGQPAVMMTDTANFRNPNYHKATDTIDTIDAARFTATTQALALAWLELASAPDGASDQK